MKAHGERNGIAPPAATLGQQPAFAGQLGAAGAEAELALLDSAKAADIAVMSGSPGRVAAALVPVHLPPLHHTAPLLPLMECRDLTVAPRHGHVGGHVHR